MIRNKNVGTMFNIYNLLQGEGIVVLLIFASILLLIGIIGYEANFIQFGLDQLLEAPSEYLGLFVHYVSWIFNILRSESFLGTAVTEIVVCCSSPRYDIRKILVLSALFLLATVSLLLLITV